jgi:DNA polymerase-4
VLVGGVGGRGVVATASYEARVFGVGSAMATETARRRCPDGVFLAPRFPAYKAHSVAIMAVAARWSERLEQVSVDEAYLDLGTRDPTEVAAPLREEVHAATGLWVSVGGGRSKLTAKLASEASKPRGALVIPREQEQAFLDPLPVGALPGVGPVAAAKLVELGIGTVAELRALGAHTLGRVLGQANGAAAAAMAVGEDPRVVTTDRAAKSISAEHTLPHDETADRLAPHLRDTVAQAHRRLLAAGSAARTVTVKLRTAEFASLSRAVSLPRATTDLGALHGAAVGAFGAVVTAAGVALDVEDARPGVRLLGVALGGLSNEEQLLLPGLVPGPSTPGASAAPPGTGPGADAGPPRFSPGADVEHARHGRGWVVRPPDPDAPADEAPVVTVRFEHTRSRTAVQRRLPPDEVAVVDPEPPVPEPAPPAAG